MRKLIIKILVGALALWVADYLLAGFSVTGGIKGYLIAGVVLGLLNLLVRPVVKFIASPLIILTLGLFTVVINAAMLWLAAYLTGLVVISGVVPLLVATLILSVVHLILDHI